MPLSFSDFQLPKMSTEEEEGSNNWTVCGQSALSGCDPAPVSPFPSGPASNWSGAAYQDSLDLYEKLLACTDSYVAPLIKDALRVLDHAYRLYGAESVVGSYNGGKDAVVIVHLMRAAHANFLRRQTEEDGTDADLARPRPRVIYFEHADEFPEVELLLHDTVKRYDLSMVSFERGIGYADGLKLLVDTNYHCEADDTEIDSSRRKPLPHPMAFILGTRTGDPNAGNQGVWAPSSHYMPPFMRVNPVLSWTYGQVWHFLRLFQLPYCMLYDMGYTSLGTTKDTLPCPALAKSSMAGAAGDKGNGDCDAVCDGKGGKRCSYWPAYMLRDWDMERAGRITKAKKRLVHTMSESSSTTSLSSKAPPFGSNLDDDESVSSESSPPAQKTVGLVIIGDEILKGLTADTNTFSAAVALREHNVPLARVSVVSDDGDEIATEIRRMQGLCDALITSGGVGPTHDDVTIKSISAALGDELVLHQEMAQILLDKLGDGSDESARMKMSTLPSSAKLRYLTDDPDEWPVLQCRNVFILPGVPQFFESKVKALATHLLSTELERSITYRVVLSCDETSIVEPLNSVVRKHPAVVFGSYPFVDHPDCKTVVTLEGRLIDGGYTHSSGRFLKMAQPSYSASTSAADGEPQKMQSLPPPPMLNSKKQMDLNVELALSDLLGELPNASVLRVEENVTSLR